MHPSALPLVITPFLRRFPTEIYNEILKFCDPSSLAKVARVPLAFLELSSPLLYRDVKLFGLEKMAKLFCGRESSQPLVEPHLSLLQIRTLTFIMLEPSASILSSSYYLRSLSMDRSPSALPLRVDELHAQVVGHTCFPLHLFNPSLLAISAAPLPLSEDPDNYSNLIITASSSGDIRLPRLSRLLLRDCKLELGGRGLSFELASLGTKVNELQIVFEIPHIDSPLSIIGGVDVGTMIALLRARSFWVSVVGGLYELVKGSQAAREVVVRALQKDEKRVKEDADITMGKGVVEKMRQEGKLRLEVLEE